MNYKVKMCHPLKPEVIDLGFCRNSEIKERFEEFKWLDLLNQMKGKTDQDICFSPSLEFTDELDHCLSFSVLEEKSGELSFYLFYIRPKTRKILGIFSKFDPEYGTNIEILYSKCYEYIEKFTQQDYEWLDNMVK